ncbi:MAG TPA: hypothetical protein VFP62_10575 [Burkholderiales bacterium]|nr:hypothetical protein [Burkholderiales bacterium]
MLRKLLTAALLFALAGALPAARAQSPEAKAEKERLAREAKIRAAAKSWRCVAKDGKKYYGATQPPQCRDVAVEALSAQGMVIGRIEAPLTPEQRAARDAAAQKNAAAEQARRDAEAAAKVQARRDQALLQTYTSERDIESVRQRAIADNQRATEQVEARIAALKRRQEALSKEAAAIKASGKQRDGFEQDVKAVAYDLQLQGQLLESRKREADAINARYDEEKRKYLELTQGAAKK